MKILALDTSSANASVCILEDTNILIELNNNDEKTHSQKLMPMIDEAFQKTSLSLDNIDLISCCLGPGSFTGVRIGIATSKAFADSKNIPTVGVSSLEALAYNLNTEGIVCALINANNGNVYAGVFEIIKNEKLNCLETINSELTFLSLKDETQNICLQPLLDFLQNCKFCVNNSNIQFVGDGAISYKNLLNDMQNFTLNLASSNACSISIGKIGYTKYKNGEYGDSSILSPIYLRKSQAEIALEEKIKQKD